MIKKYFYLFTFLFIMAKGYCQSGLDSISFTIKEYNEEPKKFNEADINFHIENNSADTLFFLISDIFMKALNLDKPSADTVNLENFTDKIDGYVYLPERFVLPGTYIDFSISLHNILGLQNGHWIEKYFLNLKKGSKKYKTLETSWISILYKLNY